MPVKVITPALELIVGSAVKVSGPSNLILPAVLEYNTPDEIEELVKVILLLDVLTLEVTPATVIADEELPSVITPALITPLLAPDPEILIGPFFERI